VEKTCPSLLKYFQTQTVILGNFFKESKVTHSDKAVLCVRDGLQSCLLSASTDLVIAWSPEDATSLEYLLAKETGLVKRGTIALFIKV